MHNELLHIGPLTVYGYGFMIAMGVLAAWFVAEQRARKLKLACEHIFYLVVWCAIGGFTSAKILFWITNWREFLQNPRQIIGSDGFVVYGGIIGGILVGWMYCRIKKLKFLEYFDLMMPSIALAQGFGRIGCFLAGCCYGKETSGPLAVTFTNSDFAPNNVALIPTQIYSGFLDFAHFLLLLPRFHDPLGLKPPLQDTSSSFTCKYVALPLELRYTSPSSAFSPIAGAEIFTPWPLMAELEEEMEMVPTLLSLESKRST